MATQNKHVLIYQAVGATQTAAKTKKLGIQVKSLKNAIRQLKAGMLGMRGLMVGAAGSMVAFGLGIRRTITAYADYSAAQSRLRTTLAAVTESYRENARISSSVAERAAINLGYSTSEATDAMTTMIQTGIGVHASMRLFGTSLRLARIGEMDTANATRFLVDTMNMFQGEMQRDNLTLRQFGERMSGQLAVAANMASTNIEQLQQAFRYAGTEMSSLGYRSHEVMSALAGLSVVGLRGTTSGTRLRGALAALIDPAGSVRERITALTGSSEEWRNIVHDTATGNLRRLPDMMSRLMQLVGRTSSQQERNNLMFDIFGRRAAAAGFSMATYNQAARRMLTINDEIQNDHILQERLMRMEEERMRGFHMQVDQLKHGLTDLGIAFGEILFGAMEENRQGFGSYVREIARGIRLLGMLEDGHSDMQDQFDELSPRVQENARRFREFFLNLANIIKVMGGLAKKFMWLLENYPRATIAVIALRAAFGGFLPMLGALIPRLAVSYTALQAMGTGVAALDSRTSLLGRTFTSVSPILAGFAIHGIGMLTSKLQENVLAMTGMEGDMDQLRRTTVATHGAAARSIPIFGNLLGQLLELVGAMQAAWRESRRKTMRRTRRAGEVTRAGAASRIVARMEAMEGEERWAGADVATRQRRAIHEERSISVQRLAQMLYARHRGETGAEGVRDFLRMDSDLSGEGLDRTVRQIVHAQRSMVPADIQRGRELAGSYDFDETIRLASRQVGGFDTALEQLTDTVVEATNDLAATTAADAEPKTTSNVPVAQDAYVNRGGILGVSSGDIIVSRRHLANAVLARQGAMAGPAMSMAGEGMMVGPQPSIAGGGGGGGSMTVSIPVILDGREIARAVGRANVSQLERGGGRLPPGQRRSLRETGFSRVV